MSDTKFLKCSCANCGKRIEYPAEAAGETFACPHCGNPTDLTVEVPEVPDVTPRRSGLVWMIGVLILLGILGALAPALLRRMLARSRRSGAGKQP